ncbi:2Fe-2S iron-sulfur cluster-binding protein, partial [Stenotrophomonas maltophilia]
RAERQLSVYRTLAGPDVSARPRATNMEMRERMSGNLCRCGAYSNIAEAMEEVAGVTSAGRRS